MNVRIFFVILSLMSVSLLILSSGENSGQSSVLSSHGWRQVACFGLGFVLYFAAASFDYRSLRNYAWPLFIGGIIALLGLFFVESSHQVRRWYHLPFGISLQVSEYLKVITILLVSVFLEARRSQLPSFLVFLSTLFLFAIPFFLILKQPDLGSALLLIPTALFMLWLVDVKGSWLFFLSFFFLLAMLIVSAFFLEILDHEKMRPYLSPWIREYQYERLNPHSYHQRAAKTAIGLGGIWGSGWRKGEFFRRGWLPASHSDSVFSAFGEEFGFVGLLFLIFLFYSLVRYILLVSLYAADEMGALLAGGIGACLAMQILINIAMMLGLFPITGVPLPLVTAGGSSVLSTMLSLGLVQSVHSRRLMFR